MAACNNRFLFPNQDHTVGPLLCDYLNRDPRVRTSGYTVRDGTLHLQVESDEPEKCVQGAIAHIVHDLQSLKRSLLSQL